MQNALLPKSNVTVTRPVYSFVNSPTHRQLSIYFCFDLRRPGDAERGPVQSLHFRARRQAPRSR